LKILVIQTAFTGDAILATPVVNTLIKAYPGAAVDVLVRKGNESLFRNFPGLRRVIIWDKSKRKMGNLLALLPEIRKEKYDQVINLQRFASSGFLTVLSNAGETTGFDKNPLSRFFKRKIAHSILPGNTLHETDRNLQLIAHMAKAESNRPVLFPAAEDFRKVESYTQHPYATFAPASVWFTKQFPEEQWVKLGKSILEKSSMDAKIFLVGGPADFNLCESIRDKISDSRIVTLAGSLSFLQTAALMKNAVMNYVNDSAPMHIASAMNAPVTVFYCSTVPWFGFGPLSTTSIIAETPEKLDCRPCGLHGYKQCPKGHFKCATTIMVDKFSLSL
jgi:ADP-heptose:LPS heptosyltransferase